MDILIEQEFLDAFMVDYHNLTKSVELELLFTSYTGLTVYTDMDDQYIFNSPFMKMILNHNKSFNSKTSFISKIKSSNIQTCSIALCGKTKQDWVESFVSIGGLYFNSLSYKEEIKMIIQNHKTIYVNQTPNFEWSDILPLSNLPSKNALISDNYILSDDKKIQYNAFPLIKEIAKDKASLTILTCTNSNNRKIDIKKQGGYFKAQKKMMRLISDEIKNNQRQINNYKSKENISLNIQIVPFFKGILKSMHKFDLHDRRLISNYAIITVGKGFDLLPIKTSVKNDYKLTVRTIFDKECYDDVKNFIPLYNGYVEWYKNKHNNNVFVPFKP